MDHLVEVALGANIETDLELLNLGGSIATYASNNLVASAYAGGMRLVMLDQALLSGASGLLCELVK